jgi:putative ABC transport system permease protein
LLAALGLYGVTAHAVGLRRGEIGIRLALGATPTDIARVVLARVAVLIGMGMALGALGSMWAAQLVASLLFGLTPHDPATLGSAIGILTVVTAIAGWIPAFRASRISPSEVLREV